MVVENIGWAGLQANPLGGWTTATSHKWADVSPSEGESESSDERDMRGAVRRFPTSQRTTNALTRASRIARERCRLLQPIATKPKRRTKCKKSR